MPSAILAALAEFLHNIKFLISSYDPDPSQNVDYIIMDCSETGRTFLSVSLELYSDVSQLLSCIY
jgi:hypothetical protein